MKLSAALSPIQDLLFTIRVAALPTLRAILGSPLLLFHPHEVSRIFMHHVWAVFGPGIDGGRCELKQSLITPNAHGVVLDIGAGYGHTVLYLDPTKATKYVALEPNANMHEEIRTRAESKGYTEAAGNFVILSCGAKETALISSALGGANAADSIVSFLTICTIPEPELAITRLVEDVLKPGGTLVFYEHVLSPHEDVAWWQRFWAPIWSLGFDGCRMDRPSHLWVERMDVWAEGKIWGNEGEPEDRLIWHRIGRFVKKSA